MIGKFNPQGPRLAEGLRTVAAIWENKLDAKKTVVTEAFHSSRALMVAMLEFTTNSCLEDIANCKAKVQSLFPTATLALRHR